MIAQVFSEESATLVITLKTIFVAYLHILQFLKFELHRLND